VASLGIKLPRNQTTNSQYSVSPQFHHAAHGYTLSNPTNFVGEEEGSTLVREGAASGYYVKDGVTKREGPLVRVQRGSLGPVLRLPVEVEWGGWCGDEAVCTYDPDMFYDESGTRVPWTVSPFEMGLEPTEIWRLIEYYKLYCAQEELPGKSISVIQLMYEELRDSILKRAVAALTQREAAIAAEKARHAKKTTSAAYWIKYFEKAEAEKEEALAAVRRAVTGEFAST
jgi:hypothetical protein